MKKEILLFLKSYNIEYKIVDNFILLNDNIRLYIIDKPYEYRTNPSGKWKSNISDNGINKNYFKNITITNELNDIRTIWIKSWEWENKTDIIKSYILTSIGIIENRFYARDTELRILTINEEKEFLKINSFYGYRPSSIAFGLFLKKDKGKYKKDELLFCLTIGKAYYGKGKYDIEVIRAATLINCQVIGGMSKIWKYFLNNFEYLKIGNNIIKWETCVFYIDSDHNSGNSMYEIGFNYIGWSSPGFHNIDINTNKMYMRNPKLHNQIMQEIKKGNIYQIFNAGNKIFLYNKILKQYINENSTFISE